VTPIDSARVADLSERERARLAERLPHSIAFAKRASQTLAGGVACSWLALDPYTIYGDRGEGSRVWDLDGNAHVDLHNGYGVLVMGHAHPKAAPRDFREAVDADEKLASLAWLFQLNAGVFMPSGDPWTISIAHTENDQARSVDAFDAFATAVTA
jgi:glutamate-1-semialdehyde aminotransferase